METRYFLYMPTEEDMGNTVRKAYLDWVKTSSKVDSRFKALITSEDVKVKTVWKQYRRANCSTVVVSDDNGNTSASIKVGLTAGQKPSKWQEDNCLFLPAEDENGLISLLFEEEGATVAKLLHSFSEDTAYLPALRKKAEKHPDVTPEVLVILENADRISYIEKEWEEITVYPECVIEVKYKGKRYGGPVGKYGFSAPEFAPPTKDFLRWKRASILSRLMNFVIFLLSAALAVGLLIASESAPAVENGGVPCILAGFWLFPISIAGVVLPFFIYDNDAIDIYDFKDKVHFYTVYNSIFLAAAALFIGGAHLAAFLIW